MLEIGQEWLLYTTPFRLKETTAPAGGEIIPDVVSLYAKDKSGTSALYLKDDAGSEREVGPPNTVTGTGTATRVAFWLTSATIGSSADLYWDNANSRLGIGTAAPGVALDVLRTALSDEAIKLRSAGAHGLSISVRNSVSLGRFWIAGTSAEFTPSSAAGDSGCRPGDSQKFFIADSVRTRGCFDSNGRLGVNVAAPGSPLHVLQEATTFTVALESYNNTFSNSINFKTARGTLAAATQVTADFGIGRIAFSGYTSSAAFANQTAIIQALAAEGFTSSAQGTYIDLMTTPISSTTVATRFRIGPSGQWGIGGATYGTANNIFKSGGASAAPSWGTVNILDSDSHGDTLTGTVVRGDLIVGNSTPKWGRFAKGANGTILQMGANDPAWVALSTIAHSAWGSQGADDHTQYFLNAGRSGGQNAIAGTAAGDDHGIYATSNATPTTGTNGSGAVVNIGVYSGATNPIITAFLESSTVGCVRLKSPGASGQINLEFSDQNTRKWTIYKLTTHELSFFEDVNNQTIITFSPASTATNFLIRVHPTWVANTTNSIGLLVDPVYTGSAAGCQGINASPEFQPSGNVSVTYANLSINASNPPSGVTITQAIGAYYRNDYKSSVGAITTGINCIAAGPSITGSVKPTSQFGLYAANQGAAGITTAANLYIDPCAGATNSFDIGFGGSDGTAVGAYFGRIPILYAGLLKYLAVYS